MHAKPLAQSGPNYPHSAPYSNPFKQRTTSNIYLMYSKPKSYPLMSSLIIDTTCSAPVIGYVRAVYCIPRVCDPQLSSTVLAGTQYTTTELHNTSQTSSAMVLGTVDGECVKHSVPKKIRTLALNSCVNL